MKMNEILHFFQQHRAEWSNIALRGLASSFSFHILCTHIKNIDTFTVEWKI